MYTRQELTHIGAVALMLTLASVGCWLLGIRNDFIIFGQPVLIVATYLIATPVFRKK